MADGINGDARTPEMMITDAFEIRRGHSLRPRLTLSPVRPAARRRAQIDEAAPPPRRSACPASRSAIPPGQFARIAFEGAGGGERAIDWKSARLQRPTGNAGQGRVHAFGEEGAATASLRTASDQTLLARCRRRRQGRRRAGDAGEGPSD